MNPTASDILKTIDALPESERRAVAAEVLRRVLDATPPDMSDDALVMAAEELFQELDAQEAKDGESTSR